ncbi:MAG: DUF4372 domain-containing protein [Chitinophagaceae bacterium]
MHSGKYVFSQIMGLISSAFFQTLVDKHYGDYKVNGFSCWKQFLCRAFSQLTHRESISDTIMCLNANASKLYHLDIGKTTSRNTLTRANENRSNQIYQGLATLLIKEAK